MKIVIAVLFGIMIGMIIGGVMERSYQQELIRQQTKRYIEDIHSVQVKYGYPSKTSNSVSFMEDGDGKPNRFPIGNEDLN